MGRQADGQDNECFSESSPLQDAFYFQRQTRKFHLKPKNMKNAKKKKMKPKYIKMCGGQKKGCGSTWAGATEGRTRIRIAA